MREWKTSTIGHPSTWRVRMSSEYLIISSPLNPFLRPAVKGGVGISFIRFLCARAALASEQFVFCTVADRVNHQAPTRGKYGTNMEWDVGKWLDTWSCVFIFNSCIAKSVVLIWPREWVCERGHTMVVQWPYSSKWNCPRKYKLRQFEGMFGDTFKHLPHDVFRGDSPP